MLSTLDIVTNLSGNSEVNFKKLLIAQEKQFGTIQHRFIQQWNRNLPESKLHLISAKGSTLTIRLYREIW